MSPPKCKNIYRKKHVNMNFSLKSNAFSAQLNGVSKTILNTANVYHKSAALISKTMKYPNIWIFYCSLLQCLTVSLTSSLSKSLFSPLALPDKLIQYAFLEMGNVAGTQIRPRELDGKPSV